MCEDDAGQTNAPFFLALSHCPRHPGTFHPAPTKGLPRACGSIGAVSRLIASALLLPRFTFTLPGSEGGSLTTTLQIRILPSPYSSDTTTTHRSDLVKKYTISRYIKRQLTNFLSPAIPFVGDERPVFMLQTRLTDPSPQYGKDDRAKSDLVSLEFDHCKHQPTLGPPLLQGAN